MEREEPGAPAVARIFDGEKEAKLIALACSKPPKGRARWTLRLLETKVVELGIVDRASDRTIGRALKKTLQPHRRQHWVIPPNGTANLFMMFAPLEGWRHVEVTDSPYRRGLRSRLEGFGRHPLRARTIVLVQDNLSIRSKASLYEAFPAVEARRLVKRFEWHYTPKHGSWLNLASELGVLTSQYKQILIDEIVAWEHDRNANHTKADWQFTTKNARIKLKHLYPAI